MIKKGSWFVWWFYLPLAYAKDSVDSQSLTLLSMYDRDFLLNAFIALVAANVGGIAATLIKLKDKEQPVTNVPLEIITDIIVSSIVGFLIFLASEYFNLHDFLEIALIIIGGFANSSLLNAMSTALSTSVADIIRSWLQKFMDGGSKNG